MNETTEQKMAMDNSNGATPEVLESVLNYQENDPVLPTDDVIDVDPLAPPVTPIPLDTLSNNSNTTAVASPVSTQKRRLPLEMMQDVPMTLVFEVGRTSITIQQLMKLCEGSFIELRHTSIDSIDVRINDRIISQAETVGLQQRYGIRFGEVIIFSNFEAENSRG